MLRLTDVAYQHPTAASPAVRGVSLTVAAGELVLLTGPTGCGKSTLLRLAAGLLQRHGRGRFAGDVAVDGADPAAMPPSARVRHVALVGQDPDDQRVAATVGDEIAFAAESAGLDGAAVEAQVAALVGALGLPGGPGREVAALSSGQRQRLGVAAALAAGARLVLLDEPLAHLDPGAAAELVERLRALADDGAAVLVVEHRLEPLWGAADRCVVMEAGALVADAPPAEVPLPLLRRLGLSVPARVAVAEAYAASGAAPPPAVPPPAPSGPPVLAARGLRHRFAAGDGLHGVDLRAAAGERVALVGPNGAGKSTLLRALAGELPGDVQVRGRLVAVPPNPDLGLFCPTVAEELAYAPRELGLGDVAGRVARLADAFSLGDLLDRPPQALSRGQRLRVAVAAAVAAEPAVLLLDEPTAGQDLDQVERLMEAVTATLAGGVLVFATHDLVLAARHATRVLVLDAGRAVGEGAPEPTLRAAGAAGVLALPPLFALCVEAGVPFGAPAAVAAALRGLGRPPPDVGPGHRRALRLGLSASPPTVAGAPLPPAPAAPGLDPRTRLALVGLVGVCAIAFEGPWALGAVVAATAAVFLRCAPSRRTVGGAALVLAAITWSTVLAQGMFYGDEPRVSLVALGPLTLWRQGVAHGLVQSLRFVAMTLAGFALAASTPPERLFPGLRALRVPFGLAFLVVTALRFVPDVAAEWQAVRAARARRGRPAWQRPPWAWVAVEAGSLAPVLARALRRARSLAESLDARGFDPVAPRAVRRPLRPGLADRGIGALVLVSATAVLICRLLFVLYTSDTWYHPALLPLYAAVRVW